MAELRSNLTHTLTLGEDEAASLANILCIVDQTELDEEDREFYEEITRLIEYRA